MRAWQSAGWGVVGITARSVASAPSGRADGRAPAPEHHRTLEESREVDYFSPSGGVEDPRDRDADGDGVLDESDNCPVTANADQADADGDSMGDPCDTCSGAACGASGCALLAAGTIDDFEDGDVTAQTQPAGSCP
jgi:hypothetical protein